MAPKEDPKASDATVTVNVDDFTRSRDSVIVSLAQLQSAVSDLSRAYINHANTVLNRGSPNIDISGLTGGITSTLVESGLLGRLASPFDGGDKKQKKKRFHDPNAPKRALTPYFLFMQSNRSRISEELGPNATAGEVNEEGLRRWNTMKESDKNTWRAIYQDNLAIYRKKMEAYKAGLPIPGDEQAEKQTTTQQQGSGTRETSADDESSSESEQEDDDDDEEEKEATPELVKMPTPPPRKRRRSETKAPKEAAPAPSPSKESPEKKRRAAPRKEKEQEQQQEYASTRGGAGNAEKRNKKKRKSDAGES